MSRIKWLIIEKVYDKKLVFVCSLAEKVHLTEHFNDNQLLNKRNEFISGCRNQVRLLLKSFKRK